MYGAHPNYNYPKDMIITSDNNNVICGTEKAFSNTFIDIYVVKTDSNGNQLWNQQFGGNGYEWGTAICEANDGNYVILGQTNSFGNGSFDIYLIKIDDQLISVANENKLTGFSVDQNYPNPFNPATKINFRIPELSFVTLKVFDVLGSKVITLVNEEKPVGSCEVEFNARTLTSGIYFYQLQASSFVETKKMVLLK